MIIYKKDQKVNISIEGIDIKVSPLSHHQKTVLQGMMIKAVNGDMDEAMKSVRQSLKYCLKSMKGVKYIDEDGEVQDYKLEFEDGELTDDCVDEILNMPISNKINTVCSAMLQGVPDKILDNEGKEVEGIKIKKLEVKGKKGK